MSDITTKRLLLEIITIEIEFGFSIVLLKTQTQIYNNILSSPYSIPNTSDITYIKYTYNGHEYEYYFGSSSFALKKITLGNSDYPYKIELTDRLGKITTAEAQEIPSYKMLNQVKLYSSKESEGVKLFKVSDNFKKISLFDNISLDEIKTEVLNYTDITNSTTHNILEKVVNGNDSNVINSYNIYAADGKTIIGEVLDGYYTFYEGDPKYGGLFSLYYDKTGYLDLTMPASRTPLS